MVIYHYAWKAESIKGQLIEPWEMEQYINGLVQDCSNSSALAMELPQSCTKPSVMGRRQTGSTHWTLGDVAVILSLPYSQGNWPLANAPITPRREVIIHCLNWWLPSRPSWVKILVFNPRPLWPKGYCHHLRLSVCPSLCLSVPIILVNTITQSVYPISTPNLLGGFDMTLSWMVL